MDVEITHVGHRERPVVLAVDDHEAIRDFYQFVFEPRYEVVTAADGPAALDVLRARRVDVVLLDLLMPGPDGLEVLARIKHDHPRVEVIVVTGLVQTQAAVAGIKLGAFDYVTKPFDQTELLGLVDDAVSRAAAAGSILLVGSDPAVLASFAVVLAPHAPVVVTAPALTARPDPGVPAPHVVLYDCPPTAAGGEIADRLAERYPRASLLVLADEAVRVGAATLGRGTVIRKPYRLGEVLPSVAALAPDLAGLAVQCARMGPYLPRLLECLVHTYERPLAAADLAGAVGCSVHHLGHDVRDRLGVSLMELLVRFRCEVVRHRLTVTDLTLDEIAGDTGFSSASHLSRAFLKHTGHRPGDYRRQARAAEGRPLSKLAARIPPVSAAGGRRRATS
jgi:CheY-like chemotaxis protein/AraC-like DNA-binding protein